MTSTPAYLDSSGTPTKREPFVRRSWKHERMHSGSTRSLRPCLWLDVANQASQSTTFRIGRFLVAMTVGGHRQHR